MVQAIEGITDLLVDKTGCLTLNVLNVVSVFFDTESHDAANIKEVLSGAAWLALEQDFACNTFEEPSETDKVMQELLTCNGVDLDALRERH